MSTAQEIIRAATDKDDLRKPSNEELVLLATTETAISIIVFWRAIRNQMPTLMEKPGQLAVLVRALCLGVMAVNKGYDQGPVLKGARRPN
jgi:hypothetical protein